MRSRAKRLGGWAGVVLIAFGSLALAGDLANEETKRLEGTWQFLSLTTDGEDAPKEFLRKAHWTIRGKEITEPGSPGWKTAFRLDPSRSPKAIDITAIDGPHKGKMLPCIYKIEGDRLTICIPEGKQESVNPTRPAEFSGARGRSLIVMERSPGR